MLQSFVAEFVAESSHDTSAPGGGGGGTLQSRSWQHRGETSVGGFWDFFIRGADGVAGGHSDLQVAGEPVRHQS